MTDNEKLIDDALTAFADREIPAPSRDDLRVALDAFEASLTLCGCEACTSARRERTGLTDHDRTSLARVLHQIVCSPGANFDRAVPGIQEYMIACADKVAAALPWLVPQPTRPEAHAPNDDERKAHRRVIDLWFANWRSIGKVSPALEVAIDSLEGMVSDALDVGFRRSDQLDGGMTPSPLVCGRHFAPYGSSNALCGEEVHPAPDMITGEYSDDRYTVQRARTTCAECLALINPTVSEEVR